MKFDFSGKSKDLPRVPNYLGGSDRRALTFWVLGVGFLLLIASNFSNFAKFAKAILPGRGSSVDTRVPLEPYREPLPYEAVQLLPAGEDKPTEPKPTEENSTTPNPESKEAPAAPGASNLPPDTPVQPKMPEHGKYFSGVNVPLLMSIQNGAPFRQTESEVWYHLFDVVNKADPEKLKKEATPIYDFATIYGQSNFYRGQAIAMSGIAKWYMEVKSDPPDNAAGIAKYYQIGFQTNPREDNPIVVYVIDLPENFPRGAADPGYPSRFLLKPGVPFSFVGIFFKNLAYPAGDGEFRYMPALIAKTIRMQAVAPAAESSINPLMYLLIVAALGGLLLLVMYFVSVKRKKLQFVIPSPNSPLSIPELDTNDVTFTDAKGDQEPKQPWPTLPVDE